MTFDKPRLVIAALRGGAGKTVVSLGLAASWRLRHGLRIVPFKKGPDYIDAGWLGLASRHPCYNLDPFLMKPEEMICSFVQRSSIGDGSLIEGNRGLYDGVDTRGSFSTAELAKLLRAPVILVLDATKVTRTAAAMVLGCRHLDPDVNIAGVVLNQVAGKRHEQVLRGAIEEYCGIPVMGVLPKDKNGFFPERHLGLVPPQESLDSQEAVSYAASQVGDCLDLHALWEMAKTAGPMGLPADFACSSKTHKAKEAVRVGILRDAAFQFYYPENLEALRENGAALEEISSFDDRPLPPVDALYIGGGFPETHLEILANNRVFRESLKQAIDAGLPVYGECGGLMFLCRGIRHDGNFFPMVGVFPYEVIMGPRPQGHGYTIFECIAENPYFAKGTSLKGHEFHYSRVVGADESSSFIFKVKKGYGIVAGWDGLCYKRVLASYSHIHAVGNDGWAEAIVRAALQYKGEKFGGVLDRRTDPESGLSEACKYSTGF